MATAKRAPRKTPAKTFVTTTQGIIETFGKTTAEVTAQLDAARALIQPLLSEHQALIDSIEEKRAEVKGLDTLEALQAEADKLAAQAEADKETNRRRMLSANEHHADEVRRLTRERERMKAEADDAFEAEERRRTRILDEIKEEGERLKNDWTEREAILQRAEEEAENKAATAIAAAEKRLSAEKHAALNSLTRDHAVKEATMQARIESLEERIDGLRDALTEAQARAEEAERGKSELASRALDASRPVMSMPVAK